MLTKQKQGEEKMTVINLKEMYSDYYIREWKKKGLPLITERPPRTTDVLLEQFFSTLFSSKKQQRNAITRNKEQIANARNKLDWRDYIK